MILIWSMEWMEGERPVEQSRVSKVFGFGRRFDYQPPRRSWAQELTSMYAKDLVVYDDAERQEVEHVGKVMPYVCISIFA